MPFPKGNVGRLLSSAELGDRPRRMHMTRLTYTARGGGCGCKLGRAALVEALAGMPVVTDPDALVGFDGADDAGVYRVRDDLAIVASVDFFTPIVDDPDTFGAIAATNALSDLHAMGAAPAFGLAITAYPDDADPAVLARIMRGGAEAAMADRCPVLGGHSISDPEPKYGLAVVGMVHPDRILRNAAGQPGDLLVLTKPIGVGVIVTATKLGLDDPAAMDAAVASMLRSNRSGAEAALAAGVRCATDISGFGLVGHLTEMAAASNVGAQLVSASVPLLPGARALAAAGIMTGGAQRNRAFAEPLVDVDADVPHDIEDLLHDPQTSGGLLLAVPPELIARLRDELAVRGVSWWDVGRLTSDSIGRIAVAA
jgi:selenide, water dikinase